MKDEAWEAGVEVGWRVYRDLVETGVSCEEGLAIVLIVALKLLARYEEEEGEEAAAGLWGRFLRLLRDRRIPMGAWDGK
jgi:hypothetical protein